KLNLVFAVDGFSKQAGPGRIISLGQEARYMVRQVGVVQYRSGHSHGLFVYAEHPNPRTLRTAAVLPRKVKKFFNSQTEDKKKNKGHREKERRKWNGHIDQALTRHRRKQETARTH